MFDINKLETLHRMQSTARRVAEMVHARACKEYGLAFGSKDCKELNMCVIHNSLLAFDQGKPWREVNYHHMRRANWILNKSHKPSQLVEAWYRRQCGLK